MEKEIFRFEVGESYEIRLMPNFKNVSKRRGVIQARVKNRPRPHEINLSFALINKKIELIVLPSRISRMIDPLIIGAYINDDGLYLGDEYSLDGYDSYDIKDGDVRLVEEGFGEFDDINYISMINIYDVRTPYTISFDVSEKAGFKKFSNVKLNKNESLIDIMTQDEIISLYDDVDDILFYTEEYKNKLISDNKNNEVEYYI